MENEFKFVDGCRERVIAETDNPAHGRMGGDFYMDAKQPKLRRFVNYEYESDAAGDCMIYDSIDNGQSWSTPVRRQNLIPIDGGFRHCYYFGPYVDPDNGKILEIRAEALFSGTGIECHASDTTFRLFYMVSAEGGTEVLHDQPIIHAGDEYDFNHPLPGVRFGKNSAMLGDMGSRPLKLDDGTIAIPCQIVPLDENGNIYNPGGGFTYHYSAVLLGRWTADFRLEWHLSKAIEPDPDRTSRGLIEGTLGKLDHDRLLIVLRGSNPPNYPGRRWYAISNDQGKSWSKAMEWCYDDGEIFYSPSSCSQLLELTDHRLIWIGNINPTPPDGNRNRYPLLAGEVDRSSGLLKKSTMRIISTRKPNEAETMTLSNFYAREDRETGEIVVNVPRMAVDSRHLLGSNLYEYRFRL